MTDGDYPNQVFKQLQDVVENTKLRNDNDRLKK